MDNDRMTIDHYLHEEALFEMLVPGLSSQLAPCAVVDGEWLLRRAEQIRGCADREETVRGGTAAICAEVAANAAGAPPVTAAIATGTAFFMKEPSDISHQYF